MLKTTYLRIAMLLALGVLAAGSMSGSAAEATRQVCPVGGYPLVACPVTNDAVIREVVISRLAGSVTSACSVVDVRVDNGAVALRGQVDDPGKIDVATILASSVRGVTCVSNQLTVSPAAAGDMALVVRVKNALGKQIFVSRQIRVQAADGVVELTGAVATDIDREQAGMVAASVEGVATVYNNLSVTDDPGGLF